MSVNMKHFNWDLIRSKQGETADPAAGANPPAITIPANKTWLFLGGTLSCVNAAAAGTRYLEMAIIRGGFGTDVRVIDGVGGIISESFSVSFVCGATNSSGGASPTKANVVGISAKGIEIPANERINLFLRNMNAEDNMSKFVYSYKEIPA